MFQAILQRILKKSLGEFLEGFDASNLSIGLWSGEVVIQNVSLRPDIMARFGLPMFIKYSHIRSLRLKIPWKSLASSKIEVMFDGLFILLGTTEEQQWGSLKNTKIIEKRKKEIQDFVEQLIKKYNERKSAQSNKKQQDSSSFTDKLVLKIIDNLQVDIRDIHIRLECEKAGFGCGLTLENFRLNTVNKKGEEEYIDRSKPEYKNEPLRKSLKLKHFGFYWNKECELMLPLSAEMIQKRLQQSVFKGQPINNDYLILLTSEAGLLQREKGQFDEPELKLVVGINKIRVEIENKQLQQMVTLSETVQRYKYLMRQHNQTPLTQQEKQSYSKEFESLFIKKIESKNEELNGSDLARYEAILQKMETTNFFPMIKILIVRREKQKMIEEKVAKKKGWFSYGTKELTEAEIAGIEEFLKDNLQDEDKIIVTRPVQYAYMQVDIRLDEADFVIASKNSDSYQGIELKVVQLFTCIKKRETGLAVGFTLTNLSIDLFENRPHKTHESFFRKLTNVQGVQNSDNYVEIVLEVKPVQKPHIDIELLIKVQPAVIIFNPLILKRITDFSNIKVDESNKAAAMERWGDAQAKASESIASNISQKELQVLNINVEIKAPLIIIPFKAGSQEHCWGLDMGELWIKTDPAMLDPSIDKTKINSQAYKLALYNVNMGWYDSPLSFLAYKLKADKSKTVESDTIINDFKIEVGVTLRKRNKDLATPNIQIDAILPVLSLNLSRYSYTKLTEFGKAFEQPSLTGESALEHKKNEVIFDKQQVAQSTKKEIMENSEKKGFIYKKNVTSLLWTKYIYVLKGNYLYLFANKNSENYDYAIYVKNSVVKLQPEDQAGRPNSFTFTNKLDLATVSFDKKEQMEEWIQILFNRKDPEPTIDFNLLQDIESEDNSPKLPVEAKDQEPVDFKQLNIGMSFEIAALKLKVYEKVREETWMEIRVGNLAVGVGLYEAQMHLTLGLKQLEIEDRLATYVQKQLYYFLRSGKTQNIDSLISIKVVQIQRRDPTYNNIDNNITFKFGVLYMNLKTRTLTKLMDFFIPKSEVPVIEPEDKKARNDQQSDKETEATSAISEQTVAKKDEAEKIAVNVQASIESIQVVLVNKNNNLKLAMICTENVKVLFSLSDQKIKLDGSLGNLAVADLTCYPNTVLNDEDYLKAPEDSKKLYLFKSRGKGTRKQTSDKYGMLHLSVVLLQKAKPSEKNMFVKVNLQDFDIKYFQQPVLRIIDFLLVQFLPSLKTSQEQSMEIRTQQRQEIKNPAFNQMEIQVQIRNILVTVPPDPVAKDALTLTIGQIVVSNKCELKPYCPDGALVDIYKIQIRGLQISISKEELTNEFEFMLSVELMQSPEYYKMIHGKEIKAGMRVNCHLSPFLMRINNEAYKFVMKCLFWNISFDDNCDRVLFPQKFQEANAMESLNKANENAPKVESDPMYVMVSIEMLTLAVCEGLVPVSVLALSKFTIDLVKAPSILKVHLNISHIQGSYFALVGEKYHEYGMIRELYKSNIYEKEQLINLPELIKRFYRSESKISMLNSEPDISVFFEMDDVYKTKILEVTLNWMSLNLQLRPLLKISKLALLDKSVQPPVPRLQKVQQKLSNPVERPQTIDESSTNIRLIINQITIKAVTEDSAQEVQIRGRFLIDMLSKPQLNREGVEEIARRQEMDRSLQNGKMNVTVNELIVELIDREGELEVKRVVLSPLNIILISKNMYSIVQDQVFLTNEFDISLEYLALEATIQDLMKLNDLYTKNMAVLQEEMSGQSQNKSDSQKSSQQQINKQAALEKNILGSDRVVRDMKANVKIRQTQISILHNSNNIFIPVLQLEIFENSVLFKSNILTTQISTIIYLQLNFFNPRSSKWEPVLQKTSLSIQMANVKKLEKETTESTIIMETSDQENDPQKININVSSQFLTSLSEIKSELAGIKSLTRLSKKTSIKSEKLEVSPYVLENMTHSTIKVTAIQLTDPKLRESNKNYKDDKNTQKNTEERYSVIEPREKKSIYVPTHAKEVTLEFQGKSYMISVDKFGKRRIGTSKFFVECKVEKLNRLLKVSSNYTMSNQTNRTIYVQLGEKVFDIPPRNQLSLQGPDNFRMGPRDSELSDVLVKSKMPEFTSVKASKIYYNLKRVEEVLEGESAVVLEVYAPVRIINCLPKSLQLQLEHDAKTTTNRSINSQQEQEIQANKSGDDLIFKISIPGCYWSNQIKVRKHLDEEFSIQLRDEKKVITMIQCMLTKLTTTNAVQLVFFTPAYVLNETPFDLVVYGFNNRKKNYLQVAGQEDIQYDAENDKSIIILGSETNTGIKLADRKLPKDQSDVIFVGGLGTSETNIKLYQTGAKNPSFATLGVSVAVKQMHRNSEVISKEIRIVPKHIIYNHTGLPLIIRQQSSPESVVMPEQSRNVLYYVSKDNQKLIFKFNDSKESLPISLNQLGILNFYLEGDKGRYYLKTEVKLIQYYTFIIVSRINVKQGAQLPYKILNRVKGLLIEIPELGQKIFSQSELGYSWRQPSFEPVLNFRLVHQDSNQVKTIQVSPDAINKFQKVELRTKEQNQPNLRVLISTKIENQTKVVLIEDDRGEKSEEDPIVRTVAIRISNIGLSLALNHGTIIKPYEGFMFSIKELEFINVTTTKLDTYQLRLRFLQLDQNYPHLLPMPVILTPQKFKYFMADDPEHTLINLLIRKDRLNPKAFVIKEIALELNDLTLRVSQQFIKLVLDLTKQFTRVMETKEQEYIMSRVKDSWQSSQALLQSTPIYVEQIKISPVKIELTAQLKPQQGQEKSFIVLETLLKGFGLVVANIDEAPLSLNGLILTNCFDTTDIITQKIILHYKVCFLKEVYKIFGSFNIIGNPAGLFSNIATGLTDMIEKPAQGLVKGPLELGKGIAEGAHSLVAHTVGGALNSVTKITGTVSSGLALLAFDKDFQALREKQRMKKPKNVVEGLEKGAKAVFTGFKEGMTGVFLKPYENAKKDGVLGFFKGTAQGLTGIVIKPVTGILDFASKTTEGLKNTALYFQDRPNENRMRCPRVFYGRNAQMKEYQTFDAEMYNVVQAIKKSRFAGMRFIAAFMLEGVDALVILDDYIVCLGFKKKDVVWYLDRKLIMEVRLVPEGLMLKLSTSTSYFSNNTAIIETSNREQRDMIAAALQNDGF